MKRCRTRVSRHCPVDFIDHGGTDYVHLFRWLYRPPRTRVYQRPADTTVVTRRDDFIGQTMAIEPKKKLFEGVSFAQVVAGAAAAATSVALASYIGIAGSIIRRRYQLGGDRCVFAAVSTCPRCSARKIKIASAKAKTTMFAEQPDAPGMTAQRWTRCSHRPV